MENIKVTTSDGIELNASYFVAESPENKIVLLSPATGVKKHIYNKFVDYLNQQGFDVLTWDWRGIADNLSGNIKNDMSIMEDWGKKDLSAMINWASVKIPSYKIFAVGHSFGGQAFGMANNIDKVTSLVTVATQSGYWGHWPLKQRYQFATLWYGIMPLLSHTMGFFPAKKLGLGENLPKGVALQWASWGRKADYISDYTGHEKITKKILAYYFTDDFFAPKPAVMALHNHYVKCNISYKELSPNDIGVKNIGHMGFFTKKEFNKIWADVVYFFNSTIN